MSSSLLQKHIGCVQRKISTLQVNLLAYWKMDETSGSTIYDSKNSYNLTVSGANIGQTGKINYGVSMSGGSSGDYMYNSTLLDTVPTGWSIGLWLFVPTSIATNERVWGKNNINNEDRIVLIVGTGFNVIASLEYNNQGLNNEGTLSVTNNTWNFIGFSWGPSRGLTFVVNSNSETIAGATDKYKNNQMRNGTAGDFLVGNGSFNTIEGTIDEMGVWGRELSISEFSELRNSGNGKSYPFS